MHAYYVYTGPTLYVWASHQLLSSMIASKATKKSKRLKGIPGWEFGSFWTFLATLGGCCTRSCVLLHVPNISHTWHDEKFGWKMMIFRDEDGCWPYISGQENINNTFYTWSMPYYPILIGQFMPDCGRIYEILSGIPSWNPLCGKLDHPRKKCVIVS